MAKTEHASLSRRERQIMDIIYRLKRATAWEVRKALSDPPSYSAVRAALRVLEEKGHLLHEREGQRYVFKATVERDAAGRSALQHVVSTFFDGSAEQLVATLLDANRDRITSENLQRISELIDEARKEGR